MARLPVDEASNVDRASPVALEERLVLNGLLLDRRIDLDFGADGVFGRHGSEVIAELVHESTLDLRRDAESLDASTDRVQRGSSRVE